MNSSNLKGNWNYPTSIWFGWKRVGELPVACESLGIKSPLLVTDKGLANLPMVTDAMEANNKAGIKTGLFSDVKPNPNGENVAEGVEKFKAGNHDGVIAFGGGSALDAGKAIAMMAGQSRSIWDFEDVGDNWKRVDTDGIAPIIAVPTTSGTGSEVGRACLIIDESAHAKKIIFHPRMLPQIVVADPELTVGLPRHITAATGMDALSHNLQAFCAPGFHPMADGIAVEGIRLIKEWLPVACDNPDNVEGRSHMMVASSMGATAFQKGLGAMHALAHPLGALYDAHHGLLNAILMPYVLVRNRSHIENRIAHLSRCLGLVENTFEAFLRWVLDLRNQIGIEHDLNSIGIDDSRAGEIGDMATKDPSAGGNPVPLTKEQYSELFRNAVHGQLK